MGEVASPLKLPQAAREWHTAHGTIRGAVVVAPLIARLHVCLTRGHGHGKGRWSRASIDPFPSLSAGLTAASIPQPVNEGCVDPLARNYSAPVVTACCIDPATASASVGS
jgi:hypothetical protein